MNSNFSIRKKFVLVMNSNFFNLQQNFAFDESIFQCDLGESLGLTRSCYLCSHYTLKTLRIDSDIDYKNFSSKQNEIEFWCWEILKTIEEKEGQKLEIFIKSLGGEETKKGCELYAEYYMPINPSLHFIQQTVDISAFTEQFLNSTNLTLY